ncbi:MAG: c-type cytochrome [Gammaproteobacteria bacterium]|nr:c-type cytochrome [Gammaproteobacteria bacterium]
MKRRMRKVYWIAFAVMVAAVVAIVNYSSSTKVQPVTVAPGKNGDLRAVRATALEVAEGKRIAEASCARCHGMDGISKTKGIPHIAGQRPAYLHHELRAYQTGVRGEKAMDGAVKYLSDDALVQVAAYYASLEPAPAVATGVKSASAKKPDPVQAGKVAAAGCSGCHGEGGISKIPGMPSLVGLHPKYLVAAMKAYKTDQRKHDIMKSLLMSKSDVDLENIAHFYALQKPDRAQTPPINGKPKSGESAAAACAGCHGNQGVSGNPATPSLAGQDAQYLVTATKAYKDGSRKDETMTGPASALDDATINDLAAFYAEQTPKPPNVRKPLTTAEWAQKCDRCHGINGNSTDPLSPALAGQRADYLEKVLHDYKMRTRKSPPMAAMSDVLGDVDIADLAAHYARQKPRSVVFVIP